jgi:thiamine-phosphate diphosphorylase / hydroxyethylthiazole kinase
LLLQFGPLFEITIGPLNQTGCSLGTLLAAFLTTHPEDIFLATLAGVLIFEIAAENAMLNGSVRGPGAFVPAFIDELDAIRQAALDGKNWHYDRFKISLMEN